MQVNSYENLTASLGAQIVRSSGGREILTLGFYARMKSAALAGIGVCVVRWTEDSVSRSYVLPSVALVSGSTAQPETKTFVIDQNSDLTIECTLVGLVGSVNYGIFCMHEAYSV